MNCSLHLIEQKMKSEFLLSQILTMFI